MNRVFTSSGWFAVEAIGHACSLGPQPASTDNPVWQVVGAMVLLISVRRAADGLFARITQQDETLPQTLQH